MPSKKALTLALAISIITHALILSATGLIDVRLSLEKKGSTIALDLQVTEALKDDNQAEKGKDKRPPPVTGQEEHPPSKGLPEETVSLNDDDKRYGPYLIKVKKKIDGIWDYPQQAFERKEEGVTTVKFSVAKSGRLVGSGVVKSSGHDALDGEVLNAVRSAAPYEPFPVNVNLSLLHIIADFRYSIVGNPEMHSK